MRANSRAPEFQVGDEVTYKGHGCPGVGVVKKVRGSQVLVDFPWSSLSWWDVDHVQHVPWHSLWK